LVKFQALFFRFGGFCGVRSMNREEVGVMLCWQERKRIVAVIVRLKVVSGCGETLRRWQPIFCAAICSKSGERSYIAQCLIRSNLE
jgi:hypothetical protein